MPKKTDISREMQNNAKRKVVPRKSASFFLLNKPKLQSTISIHLQDNRFELLQRTIHHFFQQSTVSVHLLQSPVMGLLDLLLNCYRLNALYKSARPPRSR